MLQRLLQCIKAIATSRPAFILIHIGPITTCRPVPFLRALGLRVSLLSLKLRPWLRSHLQQEAPTLSTPMLLRVNALRVPPVLGATARIVVQGQESPCGCLWRSRRGRACADPEVFMVDDVIMFRRYLDGAVRLGQARRGAKVRRHLVS